MSTPTPAQVPSHVESGEGPPLVFLHSMAGSSASWSEQFAAMSANHRCIAWDMPGFGESPSAEHTSMTEMSDLVVRMLDFLGIAEPAHLVGLSVGGMIAQECAVRHPERFASLVILDSAAQFGNGSAANSDEWAATMIATINATPVPDFCREMVQSITASGLSAEATARGVAAMSRATKPGLRLATRLIAGHDTVSALPGMLLPTLVIVGEHDPETPVAYAQRLAELIPHATLSVIPDCGHLSSLEAPIAVNQALRAHLKRTAR
nr:alpha/beta fold hydrolase [Leekyejoonella antrihumi]